MKSYLFLCIFSFLSAGVLYAQPGGSCPTDKHIESIIVDEKVVNIPENPVEPPAAPPTVDTMPRVVWWVHGLNGDQGSWSPASRGVYDSFYVRNAKFEYANSQTGGIGSSADDVQNQFTVTGAAFANEGLNTQRGIIIAHSLGGLVSRLAEQQETGTQHYGGIVTVGTSHDGALIITNFEDIIRFAGQACKHFAKSQIYNLLGDKPLIDLLVGPNLDELIDQFCTTEERDGGIARLISNLTQKAYTETMKKELAYQSDLIKQMNSEGHPGMEYNIAFYSKEDGPEFYRLIYHLMRKPETLEKWQANDDTPILDSVEYIWKPDLKSKLVGIEAALDVLQAAGADCDNWWEWVPPFTLSCPLNRLFYQRLLSNQSTITSAYLFLYTAPETWKDIVGGTKVQEQVATSYECTCLYYPPGSTTTSVIKYLVSHPSQCQYQNAVTCNASPATYQTQTVIQRESNSDGVVTVSSQMAFPGARQIEMHTGPEFNPITLQWEIADGNNHMQERNSLSTKGTLMRLFNGDYRDFYKSTKKP